MSARVPAPSIRAAARVQHLQHSLLSALCLQPRPFLAIVSCVRTTVRSRLEPRCSRPLSHPRLSRVPPPATDRANYEGLRRKHVRSADAETRALVGDGGFRPAAVTHSYVEAKPLQPSAVDGEVPSTAADMLMPHVPLRPGWEPAATEPAAAPPPSAEEQ